MCSHFQSTTLIGMTLKPFCVCGPDLLSNIAIKSPIGFLLAPTARRSVEPPQEKHPTNPTLRETPKRPQRICIT